MLEDIIYVFFVICKNKWQVAGGFKLNRFVVNGNHFR